MYKDFIIKHNQHDQRDSNVSVTSEGLEFDNVSRGGRNNSVKKSLNHSTLSSGTKIFTLA